MRCRACATEKPFPRVERLILEISSFKGYGGYIGEGRGGSLDTLFDGGERGKYRIRCRIVRVTGFRASYDRVASPLSLNRIVVPVPSFSPVFSVSTSYHRGTLELSEGVRLSNGINGVGENKF